MFLKACCFSDFILKKEKVAQLITFEGIPKSIFEYVNFNLTI